MTKDFNVKVSVRNNRILSEIRESYDSVAAFCRDAGLPMKAVNALICFREPPTLKSGGWREIAVDLATALGKYPGDLWPKHLERAEVKRATVEIEASAEEVAAIAAPGGDPSKQIFQRKVLASWAKDLRPREVQALALRIEGATLDDAGRALGVSRERFRQIEAKAMRKMRTAAARQGVKSMVDV